MTLFVNQLINAVALGGIYLLIALGITLVFGLTRIVNFAQGELTLLGSFVAYACTQAHLPIILCIIASFIVVGLAGEALDLGIFRRTLRAPLNGFIISLGLIVALQALFAIIWPANFYTISPILSGVWNVNGIIIGKERLIFVVVALVCLVAAQLLIGHTHYGRGIRALAEDRHGAQALGVRVGRLTSLVFTVGSGLAGVAGALLGTAIPFNAVAGSEYLVIGFSVAIVGGLGSVTGAAIAAFVLAAANTLGAAYISPAWSYGILLVAMIVIIVVRPYGIVGSALSAADDPMERHGHMTAAPAAETDPVFRSKIGQMAAHVPRAFAIIFLIAVALLPVMVGSAGEVSLGISALVNAIAAYSMWFLFRYGGMFSIAQAALVAVGAYATAYTGMHISGNFWSQIGISVLATVIVAAALAIIALRSSGSYFVILLLALSELVLVFIQNWTSVTGGAQGVVLAQVPGPFGNAISLASLNTMYYVVLVFTLVVIVSMVAISRTRYGKMLNALRENNLLATSLGVPVRQYKFAAFCIAAVAAGIAGTFTIYTSLGVDPTYFSSTTAIQYALIVIVGGTRSPLGPLVGALIITYLPNVLSLGPYQSQLLYGILLVVVILAAPSGVTGSLRTGFYRATQAWISKRKLAVDPAGATQLANLVE
jgi:branched-chain amino acid transport system permease protein